MYECNKEEYAIHDTECERCLEHGTRLIDIGRKRRASAESVGPKRNVEITIGREVRAVGVGYAAELVDARYEGSDEAKIHEGYEVGRVSRRLPAE